MSDGDALFLAFLFSTFISLSYYQSLKEEEQRNKDDNQDPIDFE